MKTELEELWRAVEATEMIATGLRNAVLTRISYTVFGTQPTDAERYLLTIAAQQVELARAAYDAARLRLLASTSCSKGDRDRVPDPMSGCPAGDSSP